jgi:hypothetical protein
MKHSANWMSLAIDGWSMGMEASTVIGLRMIKLAGGGAEAEREARRMVGEKIDTGIALSRLAVTQGPGSTWEATASTALRQMRTRVRANRRRLTGAAR